MLKKSGLKPDPSKRPSTSKVQSSTKYSDAGSSFTEMANKSTKFRSGLLLRRPFVLERMELFQKTKLKTKL